MEGTGQGVVYERLQRGGLNHKPAKETLSVSIEDTEEVIEQDGDVRIDRVS